MRTGLFIVGAVGLLGLGGLVAAPSLSPRSGGELPPGVSKTTALRAKAGGMATAGATVSVKQSVSAGHPLTLSYPGSSYVKPHLSILLLPGEYLTVSDRSGKRSSTYTGIGNRWVMSVDGDTAVLTVHGNLAHVVVDKVARGFTAKERAAQRDVDRSRQDAAIKAMRSDGGATRCGTGDAADAACFRSSDPVAYKASRAIALLLVDGDELCTAWRVGPGNRMLTDHQCAATTAQVRDAEVWFDDECAVCGGTATRPPVKVSGDKVLATDATLDYTLFSVRDFASVAGFGYLSLDPRQPGQAEQLYLPQHPAGDPTVIATGAAPDLGGNCQVQGPAVDGFGKGTDVSYYCDAAAGSAGSPVISRITGKVIALHHFGGCPAAGVRADLIYQRIGAQL